MSNILYQATNSYLNTFSGFINQFVTWGQWIFSSLIVINLLWMFLWYAFDKESIVNSLSDYLKRFFIMMVFYTIMVNPSWMGSVADTFKFMGNQLTGIPVDPSSIIDNGIMVANKIMSAINNTSMLTQFFTVIVLAVIYIGILFVFISIALDLALTMIMTTALISVGSLFLGFAALGATSNIARQTIDAILGNCVRMLGIYVVVGAGSMTITTIVNAIPQTFTAGTDSLDPYAWLMAAVFLFWLIAKNLPTQLGKIISGSISDLHGTDAAALAMAAVKYAQFALPPVKVATQGAAVLGKIAGSVSFNAGSHFGANAAQGIGAATAKSATGVVTDSVKSAAGALTDHFKDIGSKISGGGGSKVTGFSERMHHAAQQAGNTAAVSKPASGAMGQPSSSGTKAAAPSTTRSNFQNSVKPPQA